MAGKARSIHPSRDVVAVGVLLGITAIYLFTSSRDLMHIDTHAAAVEAWHLASTGSAWLEGDLSAQMRLNPFISEAPNGHVVGQRMAGPIVAAVPFYLLLNRTPDPEAFSFVPAAICAATLSALTVTLLYLALARLIRRGLALIVACVFAFGTPTWTISANMLWTHTVTQLGLAGAAWALSRGRHSAAGIFFAIAGWGRPHLAVAAAVVGLGLAFRERNTRPVVTVGLWASAGLGALLVWNRWMFGAWTIGGAYAGRERSLVTGFQGSAEWSGDYPQLTNVAGFLFSPDRGLLVWTPVLLILLPSLVRSWRQVPPWSRYLMLGGVLYSLIQLRLNYFAGGDQFYGYRLGLELLTCAVPAFAVAAARGGSMTRAIAALVAAVQVAAISVGAMLEGFYVDLDDVWADNALLMAVRERPEQVPAWLVFCPLLVVSVMLGARVLSREHTSRRSFRGKEEHVSECSGT